MIAVILSMMMVVSEAQSPEAASLKTLCAEYDRLSAQMTADFLKTQPSAEKEAAGPDVAADIEAQSRYTQTRKELKAVVQELGTRECPAEDEFPPLL